MMVKLSRNRGQWTALSEKYGRVAVIHSSYYRLGELYSQKKYTSKQGLDWQEAVRSNDVVAMQRDRLGTLDADGYVALWRRGEIIEDEIHMKFKLTKRLETID